MPTTKRHTVQHKTKIGDTNMPLSKDDTLTLCGPFCPSVSAKLELLVESIADCPNWRDAFEELTEDSPPEELMAVATAIRLSGDVPEFAAKYLIVGAMMHVANQQAFEQVNAVEEDVDKVWERHNLQDWRASQPTSTKAMSRFQDCCPVEWDAIFIDSLRENGEHDLAEAYVMDRSKFVNEYREGSRWFHENNVANEPDNPEAVLELTKKIVDRIQVDPPTAGVECLAFQIDGRTDIDIYPQPLLILGGERDGQAALPTVILDLSELELLFDSVDVYSYLGQEGLQIEGKFRNEPVSVHILAHPPNGVRATRNIAVDW
ncbi:MAG: hypothetical protein ABGZ35_26495 [Planctomycetaceae bacterium]